MYKVVNNMIPPYVCESFQRRHDSILNIFLRSVSYENVDIPRPKLSIFKESLSYSVIWKSILREIKNSSYLNCFADNVIQWMNRS